MPCVAHIIQRGITAAPVMCRCFSVGKWSNCMPKKIINHVIIKLISLTSLSCIPLLQHHTCTCLISPKKQANTTIVNSIMINHRSLLKWTWLHYFIDPQHYKKSWNDTSNSPLTCDWLATASRGTREKYYAGVGRATTSSLLPAFHSLCRN